MTTDTFRVEYDYHILHGGLVMTKTINATEAVRKFSELLNAVKYRGDSYTILRGKPVAAVVPVGGQVRERRLGELASVIESLPRLDEDNEAFAREVDELIASLPPVPEGPSSE